MGCRSLGLCPNMAANERTALGSPLVSLTNYVLRVSFDPDLW